MGSAIVEIRNGPRGRVAFPVYEKQAPFHIHPSHVEFVPLNGADGWHIALGHDMRTPYEASLGPTDIARFQVYSDHAPNRGSPDAFLLRIRDTRGVVHESGPMVACGGSTPPARCSRRGIGAWVERAARLPLSSQRMNRGRDVPVEMEVSLARASTETRTSA
ncbi:hypothetical protein ACF3M1_14990 [Luteimonas sp. WGS1318]|uniref:hypothetical protein n=1 Tax=Luteimonas sp. WGS1318 TaxID=3366815 RepID=UPI00372D157C